MLTLQRLIVARGSYTLQNGVCLGTRKEEESNPKHFSGREESLIDVEREACSKGSPAPSPQTLVDIVETGRLPRRNFVCLQFFTMDLQFYGHVQHRCGEGASLPHNPHGSAEPWCWWH